MKIEVYTRPNCGQCLASKKWLARDGVPFTEADLDEEHLAYAKANGIISAPLIIVWEGDRIVESWGGFRPAQLKATVEKYRTYAIANKYTK